MITNIKNTDEIMEYVHSAGCLQSIMANSKFTVMGEKNGTFPKDMARCLVRPLQAGFFLCVLFLCDFALCDLRIYTTFEIHMLIFGLT
jgi:hypothetical protein